MLLVSALPVYDTSGQGSSQHMCQSADKTTLLCLISTAMFDAWSTVSQTASQHQQWFAHTCLDQFGHHKTVFSCLLLNLGNELPIEA